MNFIKTTLLISIQNKVNKGWKEELPNGKFKTHNTHYMKVDTVAIRAIRDTVKMLINMQNVYTLAAQYGVDSKEKKKHAKYPEQVPLPPDPELPDPDDLEGEIDELENFLGLDQDEDLESEVGAENIEHEETIERRKPGRPKKIPESQF